MKNKNNFLRWIFYLDHIVEKQYGIDKKMEFMNMIEEV